MKIKIILISLIVLVTLGRTPIMDNYDIQVGEEDDLIDLLIYETHIQI